MEKKNKFCLLPYGGLNIAPNGNITPCCALYAYDSKNIMGNLATDSMLEVFHNKKFNEFRDQHINNTLPKGCVDRCVKTDHAIIHRMSRNQILQNKINFQNLKIKTVDMGLGNICKLTCTFCNEEFSSSWAKLKNKNDQIFSFDKETTLNAAKNLRDVEHLFIKGGEPLNIPYFKQFLETLHDANPNVCLDILSNLVELPDDILQALTRFENLHIGVSTEATGAMYQYLRGGKKYTWDNVLDNIKKLTDKGLYAITPSTVLLSYNHKTWPDDMLIIYYQLRSIVPHVSPICTQLCLFPLEQNIYTLNLESRLQLIEKIKEKINQGLELASSDSIISELSKDITIDISKNDIIEKINYNNKMRNMDLFSITDNFIDSLNIQN
jgi:radical SAM protein with 4Fe4S-binding SPASM domain